MTETIDITISESTKSILSNKAGVLLGQSGQISRETYIRDPEQQNRNYYMRYCIQSKELDAKKARVAVLEQALLEKSIEMNKLQARIDELESEIDH